MVDGTKAIINQPTVRPARRRSSGVGCCEDGTAGTASRRSPRVGRANESSNATVVIAAWAPNSPSSGSPATPAAPLTIAPMLAAQKMAPNARERTTESSCSVVTSRRFESRLGVGQGSRDECLHCRAPRRCRRAVHRRGCGGSGHRPCERESGHRGGGPQQPPAQPARQAHPLHQPAHGRVRQCRADLLRDQDRRDGTGASSERLDEQERQERLDELGDPGGQDDDPHAAEHRRERPSASRDRAPWLVGGHGRASTTSPWASVTTPPEEVAVRCSGHRTAPRVPPCVRRQSTAPGGAVGPGRDHHLLHRAAPYLWRTRARLGTSRGGSVEDTPEPEVCEELAPKPLAGRCPDRIELSSRPPARGVGMTRRRGSIRRELVRPGNVAAAR